MLVFFDLLDFINLKILLGDPFLPTNLNIEKILTLFWVKVSHLLNVFCYDQGKKVEAYRSVRSQIENI